MMILDLFFFVLVSSEGRPPRAKPEARPHEFFFSSWRPPTKQQHTYKKKGAALGCRSE
jgi:hypothetical protein